MATYLVSSDPDQALYPGSTRQKVGLEPGIEERGWYGIPRPKVFSKELAQSNGGSAAGIMPASEATFVLAHCAVTQVRV